MGVQIAPLSMLFLMSATILAAEGSTPNPPPSSQDVGSFLDRPASPEAAPQPASLGALRWEPSRIEFGAIAWTDHSQRLLTLTNTGSQKIKVQVLPDCGCTVVESTFLTIEPGKQAIVPVSLRVEDIAGDLTKRISLTILGTPLTASAHVPVTAHVSNILQVSPRVVDFGKVPAGSAEQSRQVLITSLEGELVLTGIAGAPRFHTEFQVIIPGRRYAVQISTPGPVPKGPLLDRIIVTSATPGRPDVVILTNLIGDDVPQPEPGTPTAPIQADAGLRTSPPPALP